MASAEASWFIEEEGEGIMKTTISVLMKTVVAFAGVILAASFVVVSVGARAGADDFDAAASYKTLKCLTCHGAKAEKKFDTTKSDDEHVQIILKGKKAEKPPNMPGFAEKGITADQAKALLDYMKSVKQ